MYLKVKFVLESSDILNVYEAHSINGYIRMYRFDMYGNMKASNLQGSFVSNTREEIAFEMRKKIEQEINNYLEISKFSPIKLTRDMFKLTRVE